MADSTTFNQPGAAPAVTASRVASRKSPKEQTAAGKAASFTVWSSLIAASFLSLVPIAQFTMHEVETGLLSRADDAAVAEALAQDWPHSTSPAKLETLAELSLLLPTPDMGSAYAAARRATEIDPSRAFAWANLAWLETKRASGAVNQASLDALNKSMDACPLCSEELIRWRFNFVLANWTSMPEATRKRAFEHADLLRWIGPNAEFLADMRVKALQAGIPFDAYRAAVATPVRTWDIGPSAQAPLASGAQG